MQNKTQQQEVSAGTEAVWEEVTAGKTASADGEATDMEEPTGGTAGQAATAWNRAGRAYRDMVQPIMFCLRLLESLE